MKSNRTEEMNYEKISRAMRYHYGNERNGRKGHLAMVKDRRLCYRLYMEPCQRIKSDWLHFHLAGLESLLLTGDMGRLMSSLVKITTFAKLVCVFGPRSNNGILNRNCANIFDKNDIHSVEDWFPHLVVFLVCLKREDIKIKIVFNGLIREFFETFLWNKIVFLIIQAWPGWYGH